MLNVIYFTQFDNKAQVKNTLCFANSQQENCYKLLFFEREGQFLLERQIISAACGMLWLIDKNNRLDDLKQFKGSGWLILLDEKTLVEALAPQHQSYENLSFLSLLKFSDKRMEALRVPLEEHPKWIVRLTSLADEQKSSLYHSAGAARAILKLLLIDIIRLDAKQSGERLPYSDPLLNRVFDFIESNYRKAISLSDVAKEVNKSTSYLTNIVRQKTGKTVLQWIIEFRMAKARCLLIETDLSVEKIAEAIGYFDIRHFSRQFRRIHGSSPKKWQSSQLENSLSDEKANARLSKIPLVLR